MGENHFAPVPTAVYGVIVLAFVQQPIAVGLYALVALMWLIPDPRIESRFYG